MSPTSMSAKVLAGTVKVKTLSSVADWSVIGAASVGASFALATVSVKLPLACAPALSVAVTRSTTAPTSPLVGVPLKRRVAASKLSHAGSAVPSACVAV